MPDADIGSIRYTIRTHLLLVQLPVSSGWSYPGKPIDAADDFRALVFRYLAAVEALKPELVTYCKDRS